MDGCRLIPALAIADNILADAPHSRLQGEAQSVFRDLLAAGTEYAGCMNRSFSSRRTFLASSGAAIAGTAVALHERLAAADAAAGLKGRINHSVCKWCYPKITLEDLCAAGKEMGLTSIELLQPARLSHVEKTRPHLRDGQQSHGEGPGRQVTRRHRARLESHGTSRPSRHRPTSRRSTAVADAGFQAISSASPATATGLDDETGLKNCAEGLKKLLPLAEKRGVDHLRWNCSTAG